MNKMVYIPQKEVDSIKKAAAEATETGGIGAYLVKLHKAEQGRNNPGR